MPIKSLNNLHYKSIKAIFQEAFSQEEYNSDDIGYAWKTRIRGESQGYFNKQGDLLGFAIVTRRTSPKVPYIHFIAVYNDYKGFGYGSRILKAVLKRQENVYLWPEGRNEKETDTLRAWYGKHGFRRSHDNYYAIHKYTTRSKAHSHSRPDTSYRN